jgi:3-isopropylmalate dehydrogenase
MTSYQVAMLLGDGIGPEVMPEAVRVLHAVAPYFDVSFDVREYPVHCEEGDRPTLPRETIQGCMAADSVLLGPIRGAHSGLLSGYSQPQHAVLSLYSWLGVFANVRLIRVHPGLEDSSTLKADVVRGVDLMIVRDAAAGVFFGQPRGIEQRDDRRVAINTSIYNDAEIARVVRKAFEFAKLRRHRVVLADMGRILETGQLWRQVATEIAREHPDVEFRAMDIDSCVLGLTLQPSQFDVIVSDVVLGDVLSVQAAALTGSFGLHPSGFIDGESGGVFSPGHGSAPDIAGQGIANPTGAILAVALMLSLAFELSEAAQVVRQAVDEVLASGIRTRDVALDGTPPLTTLEFTDAVIEAVERLAPVPLARSGPGSR